MISFRVSLGYLAGAGTILFLHEFRTGIDNLPHWHSQESVSESFANTRIDLQNNVR
jgi:hypothetical protein